jgi:hypothetical protein
VGPRAVLDAVVKRKIPSPLRESNPRTPIIGGGGGGIVPVRWERGPMEKSTLHITGFEPQNFEGEAQLITRKLRGASHRCVLNTELGDVKREDC